MDLIESGVWEVGCESGERLTLDLDVSAWSEGDRFGWLDYTRTDTTDKSWTAAVKVEPGRPLYVYEGTTSWPLWSSPSPVVSVRRLDPKFFS